MPPAHVGVVGTTAPSHVHPSLGLVRELVARGHRVTYAIGETLAPLVAGTGAEPIVHPSVLPDADWSGDIVASMDLFLDDGVAALPVVMAAWADDPPAVVLHDIGGHAGPPAAQRLGVPSVQVSPAHVAWEGYEEDMAEALAPIRESEAGRRHFGRFADWLAESGVTRPVDDVLGRPERGLVLIPRVMQPHADRVPASFRFVGPCIDPARLALDGWDPGDDGRPLLYVGFGTAFTDHLDLYRGVVDRFGGGDWRVVISTGSTVAPEDLGPLPRGVEAHRSVDQIAVLRHARAFVTHAGMGGITEALWFGVPMVAVPQAVDQFANAERLAEIGAGVHVPQDQAAPEALERAVREVAADAAVARRLAEIRADLHATGGAGRAADAVEEIIAARH
ncbi:MAG: macrolide family glycosyltransferase [Thermoleophilia bacterium]